MTTATQSLSREPIPVGHDEEQQEGQDQYLTFCMDGEEYGIDILSVQEIRGIDAMTCIPNAPKYIKGVMNLRGAVVPIVDLRLRFGLMPIAYNEVTVVIVVKVQLGDTEKIVGLVVDSVSDVYSVSDDDSTQAPEVGGAKNKEYVKGLVNVSEKMVVLLDLPKILNFTDQANIDRHN